MEVKTFFTRTDHESTQRAVRMEALLRLWRRDPFWRPFRRRIWEEDSARDLSELDETESAAWRQVFQQATIHPPADHRRGLEALLSTITPGEDDQSLPPTIPELEVNGSVLVTGNRVSIKKTALPASHEKLGPHCALSRWRLVLECERLPLERDAFETLCEKQKMTVTWTGRHVSLYPSYGAREFGEEVGALLDAGLSTMSTDELFAIWGRAEAFGAVSAFLLMLSPRRRRQLAKRFLEILVTHQQELHWEHDYQHHGFKLDREIVPPKLGSQSRLAVLLETNFMLQRARTFRPEGDGYYHSIFAGLILAGEADLVGAALEALPPGNCLFTGLFFLSHCRPEVFAGVLSGSSGRTAATFALLQLEQTSDHNRKELRRLQQEWNEIQGLLRWQVTDSDEIDMNLAVALALYDDQLETRTRLYLHEEKYSQPREQRMQPWQRLLEKPDQSITLVDHLTVLLTGPVDAPLISFSLRILELLRTRFPSLARQLAKAVLRAYERCMSFAETRGAGGLDLSRQGDLLATLGSLLAEDSDVSGWSTWCMPFDLEVYIQEMEAAGGNLHYEAMTGLLQHMKNLVAHADFAPEESLGDLSGAILAMHDQLSRHDRLTDLWNLRLNGELWDSREGSFLERLGSVLARHPTAGREVIQRFILTKPDPLPLAHLLFGTGAGSLLFDQYRPFISHIVKDPLKPPARMRLGAARALAAKLFQAGVFAEAEACARKVLDILDNPAWQFSVNVEIREETIRREVKVQDAAPPGATREDWIRRQYCSEATRILIASLIHRGQYQEARDHPTDRVLPAEQIEVRNLHVASLLGEERFQEAEAVLTSILEKDKRNATALSNRAALYYLTERWTLVKEALQQARSVSKERTPASIRLIEPLVLWQLEDVEGAVRAIEALPPELAQAPDIVELRVHLMRSTSPSLERLNEDIDRIGLRDLHRAQKLKRILPITSLEVGGAAISLDLARHRLSFEERCRDQRAGAVGFLVEMIQDECHRLTAHPAIFEKLHEDHITQTLMWLLQTPLARFGANAKPMYPGGWGPSKEGVTDFVVFEPDGAGRDRILVRGEAKKWKDERWFQAGMSQVFGTSNTNSEMFSALVIYSRRKSFAACVAKVRKLIRLFRDEDSQGRGGYECVGEVDDFSNRAFYGDTVRVFRSQHRPSAGSDRLHPLYCFVLDLQSSPAKQVRKSGRT